jgi:hypothetical protein
MSDVVTRPKVRALPLLGSLALWLLYVRLGQILGYGARFGGRHSGQPVAEMAYASSTEIFFWLAHLLLAVPAALLAAWAFEGPIARALSAVTSRFEKATRTEWLVTAATYFGALAVSAWLGRELLLGNLPITDDENAVLFGARMIAEGRLCVPALEPAGAFNQTFTYVRNGCVSAMDYPGAIGFRALSLLTHLDALAYAVASAASGVAVAYAAGRLLGFRAGLVAALVWATSPMVSTLSMTTHAHVVSRACLAIALACYARWITLGPGESAHPSAFATGLFAGLGFTARPVETAALLVPIAIHLVARAAKTDRGWKAIAVATAGFCGPVVLFAVYDHGVTGHALVLPRAGAPHAKDDLILSPWARLGVNLGFNALLLVIWFFGPVGAGLATAGVTRRRAPTVALAMGIGCLLLVGLAHDNTGIHMVGPIHYSETVVLLTLLSAFGFLRLHEWLGAHGLGQDGAKALLVGYAVFGCGAFAATYAASLYKQTQSQRYIPDLVEAAGVHRAVVLAPGPLRVWARRGDPTGTWVVQHPHPDPFLRDDVVYAYPDADVAALRAKLPDRSIYRFTFDADGHPNLGRLH